MRQITAVEPVKVGFPDGQERQFLLTRGGMTRMKRALGVATDRELLALPQEQMIGPLLIEAQCGANGDPLTAENIEDKLPVDVEWTLRVALSILGVSLPDPRPTTAEIPAPQIQ